MRIDDLFEYSLPVLKTDTEKIVLNLSGIGEGFINIKNEGGGRLEGEILSNTDSISFRQSEFSGNEVCLRYEINTASFSPGDRIMSNIVIVSTGGEANIPVIINVMPKPFSPEEGYDVFSVRDFYAYAKSKPIEARRCLLSSEFMLWLRFIGFEHTDILEEIINDPNKERAIDNFFVLSGIKKKVNIICEKRVFEYKIKCGSREIIGDTLKIRKTAPGYINAALYKKNDKPWLKVFCESIKSKSFDEDFNSEIYFEIDPSLLEEKNDEEEIIIEADEKISIKIRAIKIPPFNIITDRECYGTDDRGRLTVKNNTSERLSLEVRANESFIRLESGSYSIGERGIIPFGIKQTMLSRLQKIPREKGKITVSVCYNGKKYSVSREIMMGIEII